MSTAPTILVIDNDEGLVRAIETRLANLGYRCITAGTGAQGVAEFHGRKIDLVISDLNMPAGDGITLARSLREIRDVPIIFITGFREDYESELRSIPDVSVLTKPFNSSDLIDMVEMELTLHQ